jgi:hypothetical protein
MYSSLNLHIEIDQTTSSDPEFPTAVWYLVGSLPSFLSEAHHRFDKIKPFAKKLRILALIKVLANLSSTK